MNTKQLRFLPVFIGMILLTACQTQRKEPESIVVENSTSAVTESSESAFGEMPTQANWPAPDAGGSYHAEYRDGYREIIGYNQDFRGSIPATNRVDIRIPENQSEMTGKILIPAFVTNRKEVVYQFTLSGETLVLTEWKLISGEDIYTPDTEKIESILRGFFQMFTAE
ncbi:MAG: hypothetical protein PUK05_04280 [Peptoniphilaceae bacterium]|nr:hypothetical protein [Peptoniphilaceae bacterium]MDY5766533.1 hypothetical protein [Peptoniphilaceae bacterium]